MNLEEQVVSLELAKKLKDLGVKQESLFWWSEQMTNYQWNDTYKLIDEQQSFRPERNHSAFTVAELGEMLPYETIEGEIGIFKSAYAANRDN